MTPTPHARKRPDITITMLEGLRLATLSASGRVGCDRGSGKGLERRGLAAWSSEIGHYVITESGRMLIRTQYDALVQVLPETREKCF